MNIDQQGLHELMFIAIEQIDTSFNIWMSATFAVLVAIHLVGSNLKPRALFVVAILYLLFSLLYLGRVIDSGILANMYIEAMAVDLQTTGAKLGLIRLVTFIIGSTATLYFIFSAKREYRN